MDGMQIYYNEQTNKWEQYKDDFDIVIHCENYEEQQKAIKAAKNANAIIMVQKEIERQLRLPRQEHEMENFDDGLKYINDYIKNLLKDEE